LGLTCADFTTFAMRPLTTYGVRFKPGLERSCHNAPELGRVARSATVQTRGACEPLSSRPRDSPPSSRLSWPVGPRPQHSAPLYHNRRASAVPGRGWVELSDALPQSLEYPGSLKEAADRANDVGFNLREPRAHSYMARSAIT
jgi:hypothetical protein